jgi:hypothetical protein
MKGFTKFLPAARCAVLVERFFGKGNGHESIATWF